MRLPEDPKAAVDHLKKLIPHRPTPEHLQMLHHALEHQRHGVRVAAAKILGAWGHRKSGKPLREAVKNSHLVPHWHSLQGPLESALGMCLEARDIKWALDQFVATLDQDLGIGREPSRRFSQLLHIMLTRFPTKDAERRLMREYDTGGERAVEFLVMIGRCPLPSREIFLRAVIEREHPETHSRIARNLLETGPEAPPAWSGGS